MKTRTCHSPYDDSFRRRCDEFMQSLPRSHFLQDPAWSTVTEADSSAIVVTEDADCGILALSRVDFIRTLAPGIVTATVPRGPVFLSEEALRPHLSALVDSVSDVATSLVVNPFIRRSDFRATEPVLAALGFKAIPPKNRYTHTVEVSVLDDEQAQWRTLRRSFRTAINKAKKAGLETILEHDQAAFAGFAREYSAFAGARGIAPMSERFASELWRLKTAGEMPDIHLLSAVHDGAVLGQILLMPAMPALVYEWGWSHHQRSSVRLPVMHPLMWRAIEICRRRGYSRLDLGGFWEDRGNSDPINNFKLGFSKDVVEYLGDFEYQCSPLRHRLFKRLQSLRKAFLP